MLNSNKLLKIISRSIKVSADEISLKSKLSQIEEWDSLGHITVMFAIDKATKGKASKISSLNNAKTINDIYSLLKKNNLAE